MTRDEATRPFMMLSANWNFLRFEDDVTFELWFSQLEAYPVEEVMQGIRNAISEIDHTPVVAEVLAYVRNVREFNRRKRAEEEARKRVSESVSCRICNDYGFINVIYPTGYETVMPCRCESARREFGSDVLGAEPQQMPAWKEEMLFGRNEIPSRYKPVRVSKAYVPSGETYSDKDGKEHQRMKIAYVNYFPRGGREEVFWQYQKR